MVTVCDGVIKSYGDLIINALELTGTTEDTHCPVVCTTALPQVPECQNIIEKHVLSTKSISNIKLEDKV